MKPETSLNPVICRRLHFDVSQVLFTGHFSSFFAGTFDSIAVAVERVKKDSVELVVSSALLELNHVNVLRVLHYEEDLEYR